jgi:sec-independent protein translocase protein TatA
MIFNELRPWHLLILVVVFLALFGYKKLPDATRSVGRSLRIFKSEMKGMHDDEPEKETAKERAKTRPVIEGQSAGAASADAAEAPQGSAQQSASQEATSSTATPPTSGS